MIRLRQTFGAHAGRVLELEAEVIRFGRMPDSDVAFDPAADLDASGRHAEIRRRGPDYFLVDSRSRNGTWLNGVRVNESPLRHGDEIEFGPGGPRIVVELSTSRKQTGPMTPASPSARTELAHPWPAEATGHPARPNDASPVHAPPAAQAPPRGPFAPGSVAPPPAWAPPRSPAPFGMTPGSGPFIPSNSGPHQPPRPVPIASPAPPSSERRFGQRTVGMMIQAALAQSQSRGKATGLWFALGCVSATLFLTIAGWALYAFTTADETPEIRGNDESTPAPLEPTVPASSLVGRFGGAVFLISHEDPGRRVCHGFAVRESLLGTTRECVEKIEQLRAQGASLRAYPDQGLPPMPLGQTWTDPEAGAGLVELRGRAAAVGPLATSADVVRLALGEPTFVLSYPETPAGQTPRVTLGSGAISRFLTSDQRLTDSSHASLIEHSAPGGAGAPVFTTAGMIVGVQLRAERGQAGPPRALRADHLAALLARIGR